MVSFCTQTACKDTIFFGHMQVLWRNLNCGMWFLTVLGRKNARFFSRSSLGGTQNKERHPIGCLSLLYIRVCTRSLITTLYPAFSGKTCIATERFPERRRRARLPLSGTALLQKRNMKRNRRTEIASGGRYEE